MNEENNDLLLSQIAKKTIKSKSFDLKSFIIRWNGMYPYDRWWRKYYKIPFGSEAHLNSSHIYMAVEYKENKFFDKLKDDVSDLRDTDDTLVKKAGLSENSAPNREIRLSGRQLDNEFMKLDISQFNDPIISE